MIYLYVNASIKVGGHVDIRGAQYTARTYFTAVSALPDDHATNVQDYMYMHSSDPVD